MLLFCIDCKAKNVKGMCMKVGVLDTAKNFVQRKMETRKTAKAAVNQLLSKYGNKIEGYDVFTNKKGVVSALGYAKVGKPYTHAVSIMPDGSTIEKFVSKNATKDTLSVNYFTLIQDALGKYTLKSKTAKHNIAKTAANADFVIKNNNTNVVDIVDFLNRKAN